MSLAPRCSPEGTELNTHLPSASASAVKLKLKSYMIEFEKITVSFVGGNLKIPRYGLRVNNAHQQLRNAVNGLLGPDDV
jgi:hypothetical protein